MLHARNQRITNKEHSPRVAEFRQELRRKIAAHAPKAGAHATAIPGLTLYRRTAPSPCYPAMYEPSLNVFVQGRKRIRPRKLTKKDFQLLPQPRSVLHCLARPSTRQGSILDND